MSHFLQKTLTSRKFWAAVTSSVPFAIAGDWTSFATVWMTYAGIQGGVDAAERWGRDRMTVATAVPPSTVATEAAP